MISPSLSLSFRHTHACRKHFNKDLQIETGYIQALQLSGKIRCLLYKFSYLNCHVNIMALELSLTVLAAQQHSHFNLLNRRQKYTDAVMWRQSLWIMDRDYRWFHLIVPIVSFKLPAVIFGWVKKSLNNKWLNSSVVLKVLYMTITATRWQTKTNGNVGDTFPPNQKQLFLWSAEWLKSM